MTSFEHLTAVKKMGWHLRAYQPRDCAAILRLFYQTVHAISEEDYSKAQQNAWAPAQMDAEAWNRSLLKHHTLVAVQEGTIVGFGDMDETGYLDRLYVPPAYQRQGIATALCDVLESQIQGLVTTHASLTAKPFFEQRGYRMLQKQQVERCGVQLCNYKMQKMVGAIVPK